MSEQISTDTTARFGHIDRSPDERGRKMTDEPAFPHPGGAGDFTVQKSHMGMSLRDYFAAQALNGILSGPASRDGVPMTEWFDAPEVAYRLADKMLAVRSVSSPDRQVNK